MPLVIMYKVNSYREAAVKCMVWLPAEIAITMGLHAHFATPVSFVPQFVSHKKENTGDRFEEVENLYPHYAIWARTP